MRSRYLGRDDALVDADDAVFETLGHPPDAADVAAVEIGGEAEFGVVGRLDRLPPTATLPPFLTASAMCASTFSTAFMSISGPITAPGSNPSAIFIATVPVSAWSGA
jgi:hypothetical protein